MLNTSRCAFTLIELLVVIAIIAILAAMLLPVLNRAKNRGVMIQDLNNFKELQLCWHMYILDNNDYLPLNLSANNVAQPGSWILGDAQTDYNISFIQNGLLFQYNQQAKIYACPASTFTIKITGSPPPPYKPGQIVPRPRTCSIEISLGGNSAASANGPWTLSRDGYTWNSYQKFSRIQTARIARKLVFADESDWTLDDATLGMDADGTANNWWNLPCNRHNNGTVWSFADGHCEYWKWHGTLVNNPLFATTYYLNYSGTVPLTGDGSDDLPRTEAGAAQYP